MILNTARSAEGRVSLKQCRSNLAKTANIIQIVLCPKALYGLCRHDVTITNIFLLLGYLQNFSPVL